MNISENKITKVKAILQGQFFFVFPKKKITKVKTNLQEGLKYRECLLRTLLNQTVLSGRVSGVWDGDNAKACFVHLCKNFVFLWTVFRMFKKRVDRGKGNKKKNKKKKQKHSLQHCQTI